MSISRVRRGHLPGKAQTFAKAWDADELKQKGALDPNKNTTPPDLTGDLLPLFLKDRWRLKDKDDDSFDLLQQSLLLASRLLEVGLPYIASFLPSGPLFSGERQPAPADIRAPWEKGSFKNSNCPRLISIKKSFTWHECTNALSELDDMADIITWEAAPFIFNRNKWRGITMLLDCNPPWQYKVKGNPQAILESDQGLQRLQKEEKEGTQGYQRKGNPQATLSGHEGHDEEEVVRGDQTYTRRPLYIAIMSEYVDALRNSPPDSEAHLRATFMAGITIAHEVGHAILHQDFNSWTPDLAEPYVGDGCAAELGNSFISWLFDGYLPEVMYFGDWGDVASLKNALYWQPHHTHFEDRPYYKHLRSISTEYIQGILTQASWDSLGERSSRKYVLGALKMLRQDLSDESANATAIEPDFEWGIEHMVWRAVPGNEHRNPKYNQDTPEDRPNVPFDEIDAADKWRLDMGLEGDIRFNNLDLAVDDDEEEFMDKVEEEGVTELPMDSARMAWMRNEGWTQIEVKFRPPQTSPPTNLKRSGEDDLDDEREVKRPKAANTAQVINALAYINNFEEWDYAHMWSLCKQRNLGILHGDEFDADERAKSKRNRELDDEDYALMERVRNWRIREQEKKPPGNNQALLAFRKLSLRFIDRWDSSDLLQFCKEHNITANEKTTENNLLKKVGDYMRSEITALEQKAELDYEIEDLLKIESWCKKSIRAYCERTGLRDPYASERGHLVGQRQIATGSDSTDSSFMQLPRSLAVVRNHATEIALRKFQPTKKPPIVHPKEANGDIVFKFKAVLNRTSTRTLFNALKNELKEQKYPPGSQIALFFEQGGREDTLNELITLGGHTGRDWKDLRLAITSPALEERPQARPRRVANSPIGTAAAVEHKVEALYKPLKRFSNLDNGRFGNSGSEQVRNKFNVFVDNVRQTVDLDIPRLTIDPTGQDDLPPDVGSGARQRRTPSVGESSGGRMSGLKSVSPGSSASRRQGREPDERSGGQGGSEN